MPTPLGRLSGSRINNLLFLVIRSILIRERFVLIRERFVLVRERFILFLVVIVRVIVSRNHRLHAGGWWSNRVLEARHTIGRVVIGFLLCMGLKYPEG